MKELKFLMKIFLNLMKIHYQKKNYSIWKFTLQYFNRNIKYMDYKFKNNYWFSDLILMFQKEVADRIIAQFNTSAYGRLSILANWRLNINKICDISPESFSPRPKIQSSLIHFTPKKNFAKIKDPINLEKITRIFFSHRRKMLKKPFNQIFNGNNDIT